jgi:hypothetical protein
MVKDTLLEESERLKAKDAEGTNAAGMNARPTASERRKGKEGHRRYFAQKARSG